ncbi:unnamed protein product, partial [Musa acuminata subsp. malaccensis]|uniref:(wild Malaysian banana) hypothetical protein n=1 Tax=Musa acuminata subsp. malaccensis TaxID=214687 RepID=A0A804HNI7_MUSAM
MPAIGSLATASRKPRPRGSSTASASATAASSGGDRVHRCSVCLKTFPLGKALGAQEVPQRRERRQRQYLGGDDVVRGGKLEAQGVLSEPAKVAGLGVQRSQGLGGGGGEGGGGGPEPADFQEIETSHPSLSESTSLNVPAQ